MIKVCDALMGSGKTSAAINYMNARKDQKFIFITPYLEEIKRIQDACPDLNFQEPDNTIYHYGNTKLGHTEHLITNGENVATTHAAFKRYSPNMLEMIRQKGYTLIIDESVDILQPVEKFGGGDFELLKKAGVISVHGDNVLMDATGAMRYSDVEYLQSVQNMFVIDDVDSNDAQFYYWALRKDLFEAFKDVIVLTYMFEAQNLYYFFHLNNLSFEYIGVSNRSGDYEFVSGSGDLPEYVAHLREDIEILNIPKLNRVGERETALSMNWFKNLGKSGGVKTLKDNIYNVYRNIWGDETTKQRMWTTFGKRATSSGKPTGAWANLTGHGYAKAFVSFNTKATNKYRDKTDLVYAVNIYMNAVNKNFYIKHGLEVNEDAYALSIMLQWIWRSAIRDGGHIRIYIPSRRMRNLLTGWIDSFDKEVISIGQEAS